MIKQILFLMAGVAIIACPAVAMEERGEGFSAHTLPTSHVPVDVNESEDWANDPTNPAYMQAIMDPEAQTNPAHPGYIILSKTTPTHPGYIAEQMARPDALTDPSNPAYMQAIMSPKAWTDPAHPGYMILTKTTPNHPGYIAEQMARPDALTDPSNPAYMQAIMSPKAWTDPAHPGYMILAESDARHPGYILKSLAASDSSIDPNNPEPSFLAAINDVQACLDPEHPGYKIMSKTTPLHPGFNQQ